MITARQTLFLQYVHMHVFKITWCVSKDFLELSIIWSSNFIYVFNNAP